MRPRSHGASLICLNSESLIATSAKFQSIPVAASAVKLHRFVSLEGLMELGGWVGHLTLHGLFCSGDSLLMNCGAVVR